MKSEATRGRGRLLAVGAMLLAGTVGGAGSVQAQGFGETLRNLFLFGGTTEPPAAPTERDEAYCPSVDVLDGGAAIRAYVGGRSGDAASLRHQISLAQFARECAARPDGSIAVKVGVEGRALLGPAGAAGRFDAPVTFVIKRGERIIATRSQRVAVTVPPGEAQGSFIAVEEGLVVPPGTGEYEIAVGLGVAPARAAPDRRRRGQS